jgi:hypothetical protein
MLVIMILGSMFIIFDNQTKVRACDVTLHERRNTVRLMTSHIASLT